MPSYRTTRSGGDWLPRTLDNIRLLARYPHGKKISATVSREHLQDIPAFIRDIWFIHRELGFDMNNFNLMFAFASELNDRSRRRRADPGRAGGSALALYEALHREFTGTELEEGLRRHWFDEFKPSYCTNAFNCGERSICCKATARCIPACAGRGSRRSATAISFRTAWMTSWPPAPNAFATSTSSMGYDEDCAGCGHLSRCHTGCPVVKHQRGSGKSYTCGLQKAMYR
jgi:uncharacterized protein